MGRGEVKKEEKNSVNVRLGVRNRFTAVALSAYTVIYWNQKRKKKNGTIVVKLLPVSVTIEGKS